MVVQTVATETVHASFTLIKILIAQGTGARAATAIRTIPKIVPEHSALGIVEQIMHRGEIWAVRTTKWATVGGTKLPHL